MPDVSTLYDRLGAGYDRLSGLLDNTAVNVLRRDLIGAASGDILEVAVGTGQNLRFYPAGAVVTGVDLSEKALATATEKATALDVTFTPVVGDAADLPFDDDAFDTVVCTLAGCTFTDPAAVFAEIRRVLRPSGQALFLEHVRPHNRLGLAAVTALKPLTLTVLGCHPDRETVETIAAAGLKPEIVGTAARGLFVSVRARAASAG